jgi:DUF971 family protein
VSAPPHPTDITLDRAARALVITFDNGERFTLPAEYLRVESPSAEVQGHSGDEKKIIAGKRDVAITDLRPVGRYALQLVFDDGHDSGFYRWDYLYELGASQDEKWAAYLTALAERGLTRA